MERELLAVDVEGIDAVDAVGAVFERLKNDMSLCFPEKALLMGICFSSWASGLLHPFNFKPTESEGFRMQAGLNAFTLSPKKWIEATSAIGIIAKSGRCGGTYAHKVHNWWLFPTKFWTV